MIRLALSLLVLLALAQPLNAQDEDTGDGGDATQAAPSPAKKASKPAADAPDGVAASDTPAPAPPPGTMEDMPVAQLQALDKITARVSTINVRVGDTATFGTLALAVKACRKALPEDTPESAAFLQVWEQKPGEEPHWVYSGWMFASSPALAAMDHPVYDVWVVDCKKADTIASSSAPAAAAVTPPAAPPDAAQPAPAP